MKVYNYRFWCVTEEKYVYVWRSETEDPPTLCPNNTAHEVDLTGRTITTTVGSDGVIIEGVDDEVLIPEQSKAFPDRTGYNVYVPGHRFVATAGQVNNFDVTYSADFKLQGMRFKLDGNPVDGDKIDIQIVDVDNVLGYGAGFVLVTFAENINAWADREFDCLCEDVKTMYSWAYLRMVYDSAGASDVIVYWEHHLRTIPA